MKTIIVPVDFSAAAATAATFAGNLAAFYGANIWLYHAYEISGAMSEFAFPVVDLKELEQAAEHEMELLIESTKAQLRSPVTINGKTEMNTLQAGLSSFCDAIKPDLVVIGLSGKSSFARLVVGSNTIRTVYDLTYPVLVVPPKAVFAPIRQIGFACDYQHVAQGSTIDLLKKLVVDFNADLHVLNVDFRNRNFQPEMLEESFLINEKLRDIKPDYHNIESEDVTEGINGFADKAQLDWIAVMPKKHQLIDSIFKRSHTRELLYHTHVPVLCIHE